MSEPGHSGLKKHCKLAVSPFLYRETPGVKINLNQDPNKPKNIILFGRSSFL